MGPIKKLSKAVFLTATLLFLMVSCKEEPKKENAAKEEIASEQTMQNVTAADFTLSTLEGKAISLSDYKGKTVVLHIATTWCPFCNAEAPYLEALSKDYKSKGVEVLLIDVKESKELVQEKLKDKHQLSFPILLDEDGAVAASYAPEGVLPELARDEVMLASNLVIDREGKIQFMSLLDSKNFDAELVQLKKRLNEIL